MGGNDENVPFQEVAKCCINPETEVFLPENVPGLGNETCTHDPKSTMPCIKRSARSTQQHPLAELRS